MIQGTREALLGVVLALVAGGAAAQDRTVRISLGPGGVQANEHSHAADLSADGRFVVFVSSADNLVPGDTNGYPDIFVADRVWKAIERANVSTSGGEADQWSGFPSMSADGRWVVFEGFATNLVPQDTNGVADIFLRDMTLGTTSRISVGPGGVQADRVSNFPVISSDGSTVAFTSWATNLVPGDTNGRGDTFVLDLASGVVERVNLGPGGVQADGDSSLVALNDDGSIVAFGSAASNLSPHPNYWGAEDIFVRDRATATTTQVSVDSNGQPTLGSNMWWPALSGDGRYVAFSTSGILAPDTNNHDDVYVHDRLTGSTTLESLAWNGLQGDSGSGLPSLSFDGTHLLFSSWASNLVAGDRLGQLNMFLRNRATGRVDKINVSMVGTPAAGPATGVMTPSVDLIAFSSGDMIVGGDDNGFSDVFIRELRPAAPLAYCTATPDSQSCLPTVTSTGRASFDVALPFRLTAANLLNGRAGLLIYGNRPARRTLGGGVLCVSSPFQRTAVQTTGGNVGPPDCSGSLSLDFNARIRSGVDPALVPGAEVYAQFLYRDPGARPALGTTRGLHFTVLP